MSKYGGFATIGGKEINPVEFDGISATLSHLLNSANKSEAFSHIALREVKR